MCNEFVIITLKLPLFYFSSLTLPQTVGQVFIEKLADYILVKTTFGFSLAWDGISGIYLKLSQEHKGKSCGLCGNYNDIQSDDFIIQQGKCSGRNVWYFCGPLHSLIKLFVSRRVQLIPGWVKLEASTCLL